MPHDNCRLQTLDLILWIILAIPGLIILPDLFGDDAGPFTASCIPPANGRPAS
ncbi:MAG: hypothetical protein R3D63_11725 [Paracoccaceae bacterium]